MTFVFAQLFSHQLAVWDLVRCFKSESVPAKVDSTGMKQVCHFDQCECSC